LNLINKNNNSSARSAVKTEISTAKILDSGAKFWNLSAGDLLRAEVSASFYFIFIK
jgi:hypothetical protein